MVPGLALWLPSGYSWGAALLLLCALASAGVWLKRPLSAPSWWLLSAMLGMGSIWLLDIGTALLGRDFDKPSKYFLALPCVAYALAFPPRLAWLWAGVWLGACGSGLLALYQTSVQALPRATGFTNAIQYGDLSLVLGMMCAVLLLVEWPRWRHWQKLGWALAMLLGCLGSLLSGSRGGWLALVVVLPVCALVLARRRQWAMLLRAGAVVLAVLAALLLLKGAEVEQRLGEAHSEAQVYQHQGNANTSIGHRLAHWRLAWQMGLERPLLGWGRSGYVAEKARRVAAGQAPASVLQFTHAHNEAFDLFAKRGLLGVAVLGLFYAVPLWLFWPRRQRIFDSAGTLDREALGLCLVGLLLPLSYIGFGLTQVFLAHNSGNVFYLFMCLLLHAVLLTRTKTIAASA